MKTVVAVLVAAVLGFAVGWMVLSRQARQEAARFAALEVEWQQEKANLEQRLREAAQRTPEVRTVTRNYSTTLTNKIAPQEIIDRLAKLRPDLSEESRSRVFRQILYHLQLLAEQGPEVLPVIRDFLKQNKDVDYSSDVLNAAGERVGRSGVASFNTRHVAQTDFLVPPSLRLGLVDVLDQIGGEEAEQIMAEVLDTTGRGVEVAYIARVLQEQAPEKYKENALKAARELLTNPPPLDQPNRIDENARAYLFQVLAMYNDTSFSAGAQNMLVRSDGKLDRQALGYLCATLKDQSVGALHAAYTNPRLTDQTEKSALLTAMLNFTGPSAQANQMFNQLLADENVPAPIRAMTVQNLAGGNGKERPSDPQLIQSRLQVLKSVRGSLKDERILRAIDEAIASLQRLVPQ